jgi:hypothetical protein
MNVKADLGSKGKSSPQRRETQMPVQILSEDDKINT